jgi:beta-galactosidase
MIHVLPHWNWDKKWKGLEIPVYVYTNCESAELIVNGTSLGEKKTAESENLRLEWAVPYVPGVIRVIGRNKGVEVCTQEIQTAGKPAKIELKADRNEISADGEDLAYVTVRVLDSRGNFCPTADDYIEFTLEGAGEIAATGNGNQLNHAFFNAKKCKAFNGMLLCIVKASNKPSRLLLSAVSKKLSGAEIMIQAK